MEPETRAYQCLVCGRQRATPLPVRTCIHCGQYCCQGCQPDHETRCAKDMQALEEMQST